jgi:SsrA-binding protein
MKTVAQNRKARFDYEIVETVEAGLVLTGPEVKSCRLGQVSLTGSYVSFLRGTPVLKAAKIAQYKFANGLDAYDPGRDRPLLLRKSELNRLIGASAEKGMAIIPLEVHAGKFIKVLIGLGRGRKRLDKRQVIKDRDMDRRMRTGKDM